MATGLVYIHQGARWLLQVVGADELGIADQWLGSTLLADHTIVALVGDRVIRGTPPEGTPYPLISYDYDSALEDVHTYRDDMAQLIYLVEIISQNDLGAEIDPAVAAGTIRIRQLLQNAGPVDVADGGIVKCKRVNPWRLEETGEAV